MNKNAIQGRFWPSKRDGFTQINRVGQALSDSAPKGHPVVIKNSVILNLIQDLQRLLLPLRNNLRGRSRNKFGNYALFNERNDERGRYPAGRPIQYGMTPYLTSRGFTLIELLVVILIIGVLAAVALPQYQKAVEKSQAEVAIALLQEVYRAQEVYYLANGGYTTNFNKLDVTIPWAGTTKWFSSNYDTPSVRSNGMWSIQLDKGEDGTSLSIGHLTGPYKGTGFSLYVEPQDSRIVKGKLYCVECKGGACRDNFSGAQGDYCDNMWGTSRARIYPGTRQLFTMPKR